MNRTQQIGRKQGRRGMSVVEALVATVMLSVLSGTGITVVCLLMTAEQRAAETVVVESTIAELAAELRRDAHAAQSANLEQRDGLELQFADELPVTYECVEDGVWRTEQSRDKTTRREKFHLPFGTSWFEPAEDARLIVWHHNREIPPTMSVAELSAGTEQPRRAYRIEAALGIRRHNISHRVAGSDQWEGPGQAHGLQPVGLLGPPQYER